MSFLRTGIHKAPICIFYFCLVLSGFCEERSKLFLDLGFGRGHPSAAEKIYAEVVQVSALTNGVGHFLLATDQACRKRAVEVGKSANSINALAGAWLEYSLLVALHERKLTPCYYQLELDALPNNVFDVFFWTKKHGPVVVSCKTSLRERYKQADLEGIALQRDFPDSKSFLVTLDSDKSHVANIRRKIKDGEVTGLVALYDETNIDELFEWLEKQTILPVPDTVKTRRGRTIR